MTCIVALLLAAAPDDWPRWRGADGRGVSAESWRVEALARPKLLFRVQLGEGLSNVAVAGGRLYTLGNAAGQDVVWCLDAKSGKVLWRQAYRCAAGNFYGPRATPTVADGRVYTVSRAGQAFAFDAETGTPAWQTDLAAACGARPGDYGISGSPLVLGDLVVYNAGARGAALDRAGGAKKWSSDAGTSGFASPVAFEHDGRTLVALFTAADLSVLDPETGRSVASFAWKTPFDANAADPVRLDDGFFITSGWDRGCARVAFDGRRLSPVWQNTSLRGQIATPVWVDGHLYGIDDNTPNGQLRCVDAKTGEVRWSRKGGFSNLTAAGGRLLTVDKAGALVVVAADPTACKELARVPVVSARAKTWIAPVLSDGVLYVRDTDGLLVALDVR
ncbi:MAG TPA: PQQ-binding-like beta-propeller repeat protein [Planctomycetota bacterium]|nr:PQQ-binding-like beta-propeller repeat protein [Planctomycetota bacterium]